MNLIRAILAALTALWMPTAFDGAGREVEAQTVIDACDRMLQTADALSESLRSERQEIEDRRLQG